MNTTSRKPRFPALTRRMLSVFLAVCLALSGGLGAVYVLAKLGFESQGSTSYCKTFAVANAIDFITGVDINATGEFCSSAVVNKLIKASGKQNNLSLATYDTDTCGRSKASQWTAICNSIDKGIPIVVEVQGSSTQHWVTVYDRNGDNLIVSDPNGGKQTTINRNSTSTSIGGRLGSNNQKHFGYISFKVSGDLPKAVPSSLKPPATPTVKLETPTVQQQGNAMKLSWSKVSTATSYRVDIRKQDNFTGAWRTVTGTAANKSQGSITSYSHSTSDNKPGIYEFSVYSGNSAGQCATPAKVTVRVNPAFPNAAPGFEDVTWSFADGSYGKTIYLTNVTSACLVQNASPSGAGNVIGSGNNKGSYERWKVVKSGNNVALQSVASGKYLVVGSATSAATATSASAGSQFHIYRNSANGYYYLRMSSGNYIAVDNGTKALRFTTTQPDATAGNLAWERFTIAVQPDYTTSAPLEDGWYTIQGVGSGMYVSQSASYAKTKGFYSNYPSTENGQLYMAKTPSAGGHYADQYWHFQRQTDGTYRIRNYAISNLYMDVRGAWLWNGAEAIAYANSAQRWYVISTGNGQYKLVNQITGSVLDVKGNGTANPTPLQQYVDNGTTAQRFKLTRVDFTISYDANGGVGGPASQNATIEPLRLTTLNLPTRSGYIFTGWSTNDLVNSS